MGTAESICQSYGDKLPFPKSQKEKMLLGKIGKQYKLPGNFHPIDLKLSGSDYIMSNGQRPVNEHWFSGEPNKGKRRDFVVSIQFLSWLDVDDSFLANNSWSALVTIICQQICSPGN